MATLTGKQLKDSYQGLLTIKTADDANPLSGRLENGLGNAITALGIGTDSPDSQIELSKSSSSNYTALKISNTNTSGTGGRLTFENTLAPGSFESGHIRGATYSFGNGGLIFGYNNSGTATGDTEAMRIANSGDISFRDGATNEAFYWDASTARLGLGTTSPASRFTISGGYNTDSEICLINTSPATDNDWRITPYYSDQSLRFRANSGSVEVLTLLDSGNVGIGTDSPTEKLAVQSAFTTSASDVFLEINSGHQASGGSDVTGEAGILFKQGGSGNVLRNAGAIISGREGNYSANSVADSYLAFETALNGTNTERMRIDSSGNVGIGETDPSAKLEISGDRNAVIRLTNTRTVESSGNNIGTIEFYGNDSSGQGAGVRSAIRATTAGAGNESILTFSTANSTTNDVERMRIDSSGRLLVGTETALSGFSGTAQKACFSATGDTMTVEVGTGTGAYTGIHIDRTSSDGKAISFERGNTDVGSISITTTATAYNTSSDYRLKENVVELTGALDRVAQLKPSRFNFIADADTTVDGFLAHEVAEIVPEAISGEKDAVDDEGNPIYQGIDQSKLVPLLVGAIQELKAEIEQLKAQS